MADLGLWMTGPGSRIGVFRKAPSHNELDAVSLVRRMSHHRSGLPHPPAQEEDGRLVIFNLKTPSLGIFWL